MAGGSRVDAVTSDVRVDHHLKEAGQQSRKTLREDFRCVLVGGFDQRPWRTAVEVTLMVNSLLYVSIIWRWLANPVAWDMGDAQHLRPPYYVFLADDTFNQYFGVLCASAEKVVWVLFILHTL